VSVAVYLASQGSPMILRNPTIRCLSHTAVYYVIVCYHSAAAGRAQHRAVVCPAFSPGPRHARRETFLVRRSISTPRTQKNLSSSVTCLPDRARPVLTRRAGSVLSYLGNLPRAHAVDSCVPRP
jgi:hypothetical protein